MAEAQPCPGRKVPYSGYSGLPFWKTIKAKNTPCRAARALVKEAVNNWAQKPRRTDVSRPTVVRARAEGGRRYRCTFRWEPAPEPFLYINEVVCKGGRKRITFKSVKAGD